MKTIELLAPAKDYETAVAAINCGADAIYIGPDKFGARKEAANDIKNIEKTIQYAHQFNAKVFATVNTIIYDNEIEDIRKLIHNLYNIGIDALIFQDFAILQIDIPPIPLHASTQTDNRDINKILFLQKIGVQRVILPRELSLNQIKEIKEKTNIELECFIHGALCLCYSGQCYFSLSSSNRSGNRGDCSQPCRLKFSVYDNLNKKIIDNKHILSLKDLNLSKQIQSLIDIEVKSFKIEGRLKDINYVKNITAHYRLLIDNILQNKKEYSKASNGIVSINFNPDPDKTFNRGYTEYLINNNYNEKINTELNTPKSIGQKVAIVTEINNKYLKVNTLVDDLKNGDGICFLNKNNEVNGFYINQINKNIIYSEITDKINIGTILFRNHNITFEKQLDNPKYATRKIPITIEIKQIDNNVIFIASTQNNIKIQIETTEFQNAINDQNENIKKQLSKLGNSIFSITNIQINTNSKIFFKNSSLNQIKRNIAEELLKQIKNTYKNKKAYLNKENITEYYTTEINYKGNIANKKATEFFKNINTLITENAPEITEIKKHHEIVRTKYCILNQINKCNRKQKAGKSKKFKITSKTKDYSIEFDCDNCEMIIKNI